MNRSAPRRGLAAWLIFGSLWIAASGCTEVRLIAEYDEAIDDGITSLQTKTEDHLSILEQKMIRMESLKNGSAEKEKLKAETSFAASEEFYRQFRVELRVLQARADSYTGNELTVKQMAALDDILKAQEEIHRRGFHSADDVVDMRAAFTRGFKGILKLEIAKKRGKDR